MKPMKQKREEAIARNQAAIAMHERNIEAAKTWPKERRESRNNYIAAEQAKIANLQHAINCTRRRGVA